VTKFISKQLFSSKVTLKDLLANPNPKEIRLKDLDIDLGLPKNFPIKFKINDKARIPSWVWKGVKTIPIFLAKLSKGKDPDDPLFKRLDKPIDFELSTDDLKDFFDDLFE
jgi:hypothetical protein